MRNHIKNVLIRTAKTFVQVLAGALGTAATFRELDVPAVIETVALSTLVCLLMNIAAELPEDKTGEN